MTPIARRRAAAAHDGQEILGPANDRRRMARDSPTYLGSCDPAEGALRLKLGVRLDSRPDTFQGNLYPIDRRSEPFKLTDQSYIVFFFPQIVPSFDGIRTHEISSRNHASSFHQGPPLLARGTMGTSTLSGRGYHQERREDAEAMIDSRAPQGECEWRNDFAQKPSGLSPRLERGRPPLNLYLIHTRGPRF